MGGCGGKGQSAKERKREWIEWNDKGGATLGSPVTCSPTLIHLSATAVLNRGGKAGHPSRIWVNRISLHLRSTLAGRASAVIPIV